MEQIVAIGRRKAAVARVFLSHGSGKITINKKDYTDYVSVSHLRDEVTRPLRLTEQEGKFDIKVNVNGGGVMGQAEAIRLGICRALVKLDAELKPVLKAEKLMTRDSRVVERKKPGYRKARKKEQYSKR